MKLTPQNLKERIVDYLNQNNLEKLAFSMGYQSPKETFRERIKSITDNEFLGLGSGNYDFRYSDREFLAALCEILDLDKDDYMPCIQEIIEQLNSDRSAFQRFIWIDTQFRRKTEPIFALAACEHLRKIRLGASNQDIEVQLQEVGEIIRKHFSENSGTLGIWGNIFFYHAHLEMNKTHLLSPQGALLTVVDAELDATNIARFKI